jgi:hypothetical protein
MIPETYGFIAVAHILLIPVPKWIPNFTATGKSGWYIGLN